jgi:hypothetical protein
MKAIAVLTMFFLPGTFFTASVPKAITTVKCATFSACEYRAFLAMPLFDWAAPTPSVINVADFGYIGLLLYHRPFLRRLGEFGIFSVNGGNLENGKV